MTPERESTLRRLARAAFRPFAARRRPIVDGELPLEGVRGVVRVLRDAHGIPSILAEHEDDAWFGLGFCHGQDRALQLEILVRTARGTLAEVVGLEGVPVDRLSRRLGVRRAAAAQLAVARPSVRSQLDAYARGINQGATRGMLARSAELALLGIEPTPWEAADVQAISVLLCFALASNWDLELLRLEVLRRDGPDAVRAIDARYPADQPTTLQALSAFGASGELLAGDLAALGDVFPLGGASNAWAVAPSRTRTRAPILAADPHLPPEAPAQWYLAHLEAPGLRVAGAAFVGIPGVGIGHNGFAAWAVTAAHADNTDLFLEEIGDDGRSIREGDRFVPCETRHEVIAIKGQLSLALEVLVGPRGPIVGDVFDGAHTAPSPGRGARAALAMRATWLDPRPYTGLLRAHEVRSADDFHALFREGSTSSVGAVYADRDGHVAFRLGAEIPVRSRGAGTMPRPGWQPGEGWSGLVPFEAMPAVTDPPHGFVATANNAPAPQGGAAPWLGADFLDGYRIRRIVQVLSSRDDWDVARTQELQKDVLSLAFLDAREAVVDLDPVHADDDARLALALLRGWDGRMTASSPAAAVWSCFVAALGERIARRWAPHTAARALGLGFHPVLPRSTVPTRRTAHVVESLRTRPEGWFDLGHARSGRGWDAAIATALGDAVRRLRRAAGDDPGAWAWGQVRPVRLVHPLGKAVAALAPIYGIGPFPGEGDATTIVQGTLDFLDPLGGPLGVPNLRVVIDLADVRRSRFALLGGQSGDPCSAHYEDQVVPWRGAGVPLASTRDDAAAAAIHELVLRPR